MTVNVESIRQVRGHLADVVDLAAADQPTVVTRRGREVAAVVPVGMLRQFRAWEEAYLNALIDERMANDAPGVPLAEVLRQTLARDE
jgi:prevent-host-death family protein